ncbi:sugar ABC transporter ATP-binding protein [Phyllobacterium chamaecytisi]|uniref:sugar ABC transporter ATP-binding protein n=1 Tax=Phyllobacterium chamaecytisi TaxID=2876082 RepID=UPI001CCB97E4|nr:sugar ABC transporter ATP-binding protein [Phyllobacterium sp. KW56]MBZ9606024.1 sugar ABC transporter ATP-binding protein [Phyllobacterium sp. KW56]
MTMRITAPASGGASGTPLVRLANIDKHFGGTYALRNVSLALKAGEIHAVVGENGAGKSTLIKIMVGAYARSAGELFWKGLPLRVSGPRDMLALGIYAVNQEMLLCPHLTVAENLFLGCEAGRYGLLRARDMERQAQAILDDLGFSIDSRNLLFDLSIGQRQLVAIARAAIYQSELVIFDEPTAYLSRSEADLLFTLIRRFRKEGRAIVYISHRMEEIFELADRVSVLRDGQLLSTRPIQETTPNALIAEMAARPIGDIHHKESVAIGETLLEIEGLSGPGFDNISMTVKGGEIVGLFGLVGSGRSEFVRSVFGRTSASAGTIRRGGKSVRIRRESDAIEAGMALIPESRRYEGLCLQLDVGSNISLANLPALSRFGVIDTVEEQRRARQWMSRLKVAANSEAMTVGRLSGGNQQKVVIAKWLEHGADIFIFDEPTVGVDVAAKAEIYKTIAQLLQKGAGVIIISSYLPEVYDLADSLHVFREGRQVAQFAHKQVGHDVILAKAIGA